MTDATPPPPQDGDNADTVEVESLFQIAKTAHNLYVEEHFNQIESYNPQDPLLALKSYAAIGPEDSFLEVLVRFWSFYVLVGKAAFFSPPTYSIPIDFYEQSIVFKPQVVLSFLEPYSEVEPTFRPVEARIGFRITKVPAVDINESYARNLAIKIKELFALERFSYRKGWLKVTYADNANGYDFRLLVSTEAEAIRVIEQVLQIQGDAFDETKIVIHSSQAVFPAVPPVGLVYGKERRLPRKRPVATVRFIRAELKLWGMPSDIVLVDLTGRSRNPLVQ